MSFSETNIITSINESSDQLKDQLSNLPNTVNHSLNKGRFYYTVGHFNFLIEKSIKAENLYGKSINDVPHSPEWCTGIVNVRGNIIPIVNMHIFLKTGLDSSGKDSRLLLLEHREYSPIIFQIDSLPKIAFINEYNDGELPKTHPVWLVKHYKKEANHLYEVDHSKLLAQLINSRKKLLSKNIQ